MAAEALPAPMTIRRPRGAGGRWGGTQCEGWAAAMAASNMACSKARGAGVVVMVFSSGILTRS